MTGEEKWRPRSLPSPLEQARLDRLNPRTGELRLRNGSNMFWGHALAWGLVGAAALGLNKSILTDSDPMTPAEVLAYATGIFLASVTALCVLGRPYVTVGEGTALVRNPMRTYRFQLADVESLNSGFCGFPRLIVAGRGIRVMGLEESTLDTWPVAPTTWRSSIPNSANSHRGMRTSPLRVFVHAGRSWIVDSHSSLRGGGRTR